MKILIFITAALVSLLFYSCDLHDNYDIDYFKIKVDSVSIADTINATDTLKIHLFGVIGDNGCYSFDRYERSGVNNYLVLTLWGKHIKSTTCTMMQPLLNDIYKVNPDTTGYYYINISQPNGTTLRDSCFVR